MISDKLNRREFLTTTAISGLSAALTATASAKERKKTKDKAEHAQCRENSLAPRLSALHIPRP